MNMKKEIKNKVLKGRSNKSIGDESPEEQVRISTVFRRFCPTIGEVVEVEGGLHEWEAEVQRRLEKRNLSTKS